MEVGFEVINISISAGVEATERAKILGHSVEVNLRNYTFANRDYCNKTRKILNSQNS